MLVGVSGEVSEFLFLLQTAFLQICPSCCIDDSSHTGLPMQGFCQGDKRGPGDGDCFSSPSRLQSEVQCLEYWGRMNRQVGSLAESKRGREVGA